MYEIKDLLARFKNILNTIEWKKQSVQEIILKNTGITVDLKDMNVKNSILYLDIKPIHKNEVFMKKEKIILSIGESLGVNFITEIR